MPALRQKNSTLISTSVRNKNVSIEDLYELKICSIWKAFVSEGFSFWMCCLYLFFEYVRPHAIWTWLDFYPYWARTFVILAFLGWLLDSKNRFVWNKISTGIIIFQLVIIISSINAYWPSFAWENFMQYFNWVIVYFVMTQIVNTKKRFLLLFFVFYLVSFKLSFFGFRFLATTGFSSYGISGPVGFFQNPGELAIQMLIFAPISLFFAIGLNAYLKKWQRLLLYFVPITAAITVLGTNTRGGQIALVVQIMALVLMTRHRIKAFIAVVLIIIIGIYILPDQQKTRFESVGKDETSIQRILYLKNGWEMIKENPYFGVGYFNFIPYYSLHYTEDIFTNNYRYYKQEDPLKRAELPHNIFIQVGTDTGFVGLFVYIYLIISGFLKVHLKNDLIEDYFVSCLKKGFNLSLLGFLIAGQFVSVAYYPFFWIHLLFVSALTNFLKKQKLQQIKI